jgi:hypothetical protein
MTNRSHKKRPLRWAISLLFLLAGAMTSGPQLTGFGQKRPADRWNPTNIPSGTEFVGDQVCAACHQQLVTKQQKSSMGVALEPVAESAVLTAHPLLRFQAGRFAYEIKRQGQQSIFTVSDGAGAISLPILYAFGQGKAGQTYVLEYNGAFYESRVSYYQQLKGLDYTIGASTTPPRDLQQALGRRLSQDDALKCFNCHSTGGVSGGQLHLDKLTPGVRCEACHGPGGAHAAAVKAGRTNAKLIFNPANLSGDEVSQNYCGACHQGNDDYTALQRMGIINVRFQPYRISSSKCYADDQRISCTACHDPHDDARHEAAYYDAKCLACHQTGGKAKPVANVEAPRCRVGTKNCATCHMPKLEPPGAHFKFTDHRIRIVKPGAPFPN